MTTEYLLEEICQLTIENKELKNRNAILGGFVTKVRSECRKRSEVEDDFFGMMVDSCNRILEQAPSQSLVDIKADAVRDYEASLSSFPWTAEEYIEKMIRGKS